MEIGNKHNMGLESVWNDNGYENSNKIMMIGSNGNENKMTIGMKWITNNQRSKLK